MISVQFVLYKSEEIRVSIFVSLGFIAVRVKDPTRMSKTWIPIKTQTKIWEGIPCFAEFLSMNIWLYMPCVFCIIWSICHWSPFVLNYPIYSPTGMKELSPPSVNLKKLLETETLPSEPILIVISPGADPSQELQELAAETIGVDKYHQVRTFPPSLYGNLPWGGSLPRVAGTGCWNHRRWQVPSGNDLPPPPPL